MLHEYIDETYTYTHNRTHTHTYIAHTSHTHTDSYIHTLYIYMGPQGGFEVMAEAKYLRGHGACPWVKAFFIPHTAEVLRSSTVIYNAVFTSTQKSFV